MRDGLRNDQVGLAVAVQVEDRERRRSAADAELVRLDVQAPGRRGEPDPDGPILRAAEREVGPAVAVQIADGDRLPFAEATRRAQLDGGREREARRRTRPADGGNE